ncbi:hypothetical protein IEQ34_014405 [Dendrobium chrysotoxum]|uniref:RING-type domain-containing protein n=1 Tax=Dendrobium chrysotoxum TaxID=161865 RepID=A0AAV7GLY6_DENCH|nr:hypothetical protein IEQ34_014405 [Dendrobium chrysotoxum]
MELQASNPAPLPPMQSPFSQNNRHLSSFFICFLLAAVFSVVFSVAIRLFLHRQVGLGADLHHAPPPLPPEKPSPFIADSLPSVVFSPQAQTRSADCAICLSDFTNGEMVRLLPVCDHCFHIHCIEGWISSHASCPTCRRSCWLPEPLPMEP